MGQRSQLREVTNEYTLRTGDVVTVRKTYFEHVTGWPFCKPSPTTPPDRVDLINVKVKCDALSDADQEIVRQWFAQSQFPTDYMDQLHRMVEKKKTR